jgi:hypothetical protein
MIDFRWAFIQPIVFNYLLLPYILQVISYVLFVFYSTYDDVEALEESEHMELKILICEIIFIVICVYNLILEFFKGRAIGCNEYFLSEKGSLTNYV